MFQQWTRDSFDYSYDDERLNFDKNGKIGKGDPILPSVRSVSFFLGGS